MSRLWLVSLPVIAAFILHEGGHWMAAFCFGYRIKFRREGIRGVWDMPDAAKWKQRIIAISGFGTEFLAAPIFYSFWPEFGLRYVGVIVAHLIAYPLYAGEESDFRWLA